MRAGALRHRVEFQTTTTVQDASGGFPESWSEFDTVWAEILPVRASEHREGEQTEGNITHKIKIRGRLSITTKMRAVFESRVFHIVGVRDFRGGR